MNWRIGFSAGSLKFIKKDNLEEDSAVEKILLALRKFIRSVRNSQAEG